MCTALASSPLAEVAKIPGVRRIGWLAPFAQPSIVVQRQEAALKEFGWVAERNLVIDRRYGNADLLRRSAEDFVRLKVDLIVTVGTLAAVQAKRATTTIPILMWSAGDPVAAGLVASLSRPEGNITGYALLGPEIDAKRLSMLRELLPTAKRVGETEDSTNPYYVSRRRSLEAVYRSLGFEPVFLDIAGLSNVADAVVEAAHQRAQALCVEDALFKNDAEIAVFMGAVSLHVLPAMVDDDELLDAGGLLSYTYNTAELDQRGAAFVNRILRGAKPAELAVEQPTKFDLGINLKTAKTLGIAVPQSLLLRADRIVT